MKTSIVVALVMVLGLTGVTCMAQTAHEFDAAAYTKIAKQCIVKSIKGDTSGMQENLQELVEMGVAGCLEHQGEAETPAKEVELMQLTIDNAGGMSQLTLDDVEAQWHEGGTPKAKGIDIDAFDHFDEVMCHLDAVVHPATCIICLREYNATDDADRKDELMAQIKDELKEVVEHLKHLE